MHAAVRFHMKADFNQSLKREKKKIGVHIKHTQKKAENIVFAASIRGKKLWVSQKLKVRQVRDVNLNTIFLLQGKILSATCRFLLCKKLLQKPWHEYFHPQRCFISILIAKCVY